MRYANRLRSGLLILYLAIFLLVGCVPEQEGEPSNANDATPAEQDSQAKIELQALQAKYDELSANYDAVKSELEITQGKYDELSIKNEGLSAQYNELSVKYDELSTRYEQLSAKYDELGTEYDTLIKGTANVTEEDVEQAIFEMINQERKDNGLNKLEWSNSLYWWARDHSTRMATIKSLEYSENLYLQEIFRAAGYSTLDQIAKAAFIIWKENLTQYERNFLHTYAEIGAVGVSKSGEIFYITYFADIQR